MALMESWHIKSRAHCCVLTEKRFEVNETIIAALFPDVELSGWVRRDYSLAAWENLGSEVNNAFSFWRTIYYGNQVTEKASVTKESPIDLLRRLVEEEEEHTETVRFILAVMLERQRLIRETDTQHVPLGILRVYEHRKDGDVFLIRDPNLPLDQIESVQTEVIELLENGGRFKNVEVVVEVSDEKELSDTSSGKE
jgi:hypothetical protein